MVQHNKRDIHMSEDILPREAKRPARPPYGWFKQLLGKHANEWISLEYLEREFGAKYGSLASNAWRANHSIRLSEGKTHIMFVPKDQAGRS
jgi:hypothetical protein